MADTNTARGRWVFSPAELMELADRLISRGTSKIMPGEESMKRDCLSAGRILAHLLLTERITTSVVLGKKDGGNGAG
jgi:hypothetical protein